MASSKLHPGQITPEGRRVGSLKIGIITEDGVKRSIEMIYTTDEEIRNIEEVEIVFQNYPDELKDMASRKFREFFWKVWESGLLSIKDPEEYRAKSQETSIIPKLYSQYREEIFPEDLFPRATHEKFKEVISLTRAL